MWLLTLILMAVPSAATGIEHVVSYECTSFPKQAGWELLQEHCKPEEWLSKGWLIHHVGATCQRGPNRGQLDYGRSIRDFAGTERFFIEWRLETNGPREELVGTAPASLVAGGLGSALYHFTIARDQFRLDRGRQFPVLRIDLEPGIPHTFRLELDAPPDADPTHLIFVDDELLISDESVGEFPRQDSEIKWRAKSWFVESTTRWDYIRYGVIPEDGSGDFDSDEDVDQDDYYYFHECLAASGPDVDAGPGCRFADFDHDADVDLDDFAAFTERFTDSD